MSAYGTKVIAVLDTQSAFGITIKQLKENVDTLLASFSTLTGLAPETLDTLAEIASAIQDLQARTTTLEFDPTTQTLLDAALALKADIASPTFTGTPVAPTATAGTNTTQLATTAFVSTAVSNVIDAAPAALDTLNELAAALSDDSDFATTITNSIAAVQTDVDANETASDAAEAALSARLDTLEADPTTATALAAVQADVDANETASDAAEAALSARITTLEADPTTATALAAVQADVDANETASDSADAALSGRLDTLEADPTTQTIVDALETALDGRLDVLELDPTTQTLLDAEATTRGDADNLLSGRLDTLEVANNNRGGGISSTAFQFKTDTTQGAASGTLRFNNATPASVTELYVSYTNKSGVDLQNVYPELLKSGVRIYIQTESDATKYLAADINGAITDNGSDFTIPVTNLVVGNLPSNNDKVQFAVVGTTSITAALDGRLDVLEADPTTATALTNGLALKADLAGATFTGDVIVDEGDGPTIKLETSQTGNAGIVINGASGVYAYIDTAAGFANDSLQVYSGLFWVRAINGGDGTAMFDGDVTLNSGLTFSNGLTDAADDTAAASAGIAVGQIYRNGSQLMIRVS